MNKYYKYICINITTLCICLSSLGCNGCSDYSVELPNGYLLARTNPDTIIIMAPSSLNVKVYKENLAVPTKIVGLGIQGDIVFGKNEKSPDADVRISGPEGYFILDTKNHKVQLGLDKKNWLSQLNSFGIKQEPDLKKPSKSFK